MTPYFYCSITGTILRYDPTTQKDVRVYHQIIAYDVNPREALEKFMRQFHADVLGSNRQFIPTWNTVVYEIMEKPPF